MMSCRELVEILFDFLADELPAEHRQRVEQHLRVCPPCVVYVETYQATVRLTRRLPDAPPPPQVLHKLQAALCPGRQAPPAAGT